MTSKAGFSTRSFSVYSLLTLIILLGFFLRLFHLAAVPLRGDEAFSVQYWARQALSESLGNTATIEPHPVLTYALFRVWGLLVGTSEFTMRLLPALTNVIGIAAVYAIGRGLKGQRVGLLAALFFALHPYEIWHSQDARNYAIWAGFSAFSLALGLRALHHQRGRDWFAYGLAAAITVNTFYFEWLILVAFGLYVVAAHWRQRATWLHWLLAVLPAFVTSAASFLILQGTLIASGDYSGTTSSRLDLGRLLTWFLPALTFGDKSLPPDFSAALWPIPLLTFALVFVLLWRGRTQATLFLAALGFAPTLLLAAATVRLNIFDPRYILASVPAFILAFALLASEISRLKPWLKGGAALLLAGYGLVTAFSLSNNYFDPAYIKSPNWPALTAYLSDHVTERDWVLQLSVDAAFGYYYHAAADAPALPEKPSQPGDEIRQRLEDASSRFRSIWIVGQTFPDWPNAGVVENWLDEHMQRVRNGTIDHLHFSQYLPWEVAAEEIQPQPLTALGDLVDLVNAQVFLPPVPGGELTVWLYWRPRAASPAPLKIFVHLTGALNPASATPLWTQDDHFPQNGRVNTMDWTPGTVYRDVYTLPLVNIPPGTYSLSIGFYNAETNERLITSGADHYTLQSVELK